MVLAPSLVSVTIGIAPAAGCVTRNVWNRNRLTPTAGATTHQRCGGNPNYRRQKVRAQHIDRLCQRTARITEDDDGTGTKRRGEQRQVVNWSRKLTKRIANIAPAADFACSPIPRTGSWCSRIGGGRLAIFIRDVLLTSPSPLFPNCRSSSPRNRKCSRRCRCGG